MNDHDRHERNALLLAQCWPPFGDKVGVILSRMESERWRPRVQQAWRSPAEQADDVRKKVSTILFGFHNVTGSGGKPESLAVDLVDDDAPLAAQALPDMSAIWPEVFQRPQEAGTPDVDEDLYGGFIGNEDAPRVLAAAGALAQAQGDAPRARAASTHRR